jgi:hypothetical protein
MGWAYSTKESYEKFMQTLTGKPAARTPFARLGLNERIILKESLNKWVWIGFIFLRKGNYLFFYEIWEIG